MKSIIFAIVSLHLLTFSVNSQSIKTKSSYTKPGCIELGGNLFFTSTTYTNEINGVQSGTSDDALSTFAIDASAGVFIVKGFKLSLEPAIQIQSSGDFSYKTMKLYFTPEYVFDVKSNVYPYLGASAGYSYMGYGDFVGAPDSRDGFSWGAKAGMKINAFGNALINFGAKYNSESYNRVNDGGIEYKHRDNIFGVTLGVSVFFSK